MKIKATIKTVTPDWQFTSVKDWLRYIKIQVRK